MLPQLGEYLWLLSKKALRADSQPWLVIELMLEKAVLETFGWDFRRQ
jgi:hypothetical protein